MTPPKHENLKVAAPYRQCVVGVNKVKMVAISSLQQLCVLGDLKSVPANVRNYEALGGVESSDHARYHTKTSHYDIKC